VCGKDFMLKIIFFCVLNDVRVSCTFEKNNTLYQNIYSTVLVVYRLVKAEIKPVGNLVYIPPLFSCCIWFWIRAINLFETRYLLIVQFFVF
jgi:hypothetical protein